jgi:hypothetical protein
VFDAWVSTAAWGRLDPRLAVVNYEQAVEPFRQTDRLSDSERAMLMGVCLAPGLWLVAEEGLNDRTFTALRPEGRSAFTAS